MNLALYSLDIHLNVLTAIELDVFLTIFLDLRCYAWVQTYAFTCETWGRIASLAPDAMNDDDDGRPGGGSVTIHSFLKEPRSHSTLSLQRRAIFSMVSELSQSSIKSRYASFAPAAVANLMMRWGLKQKSMTLHPGEKGFIAYLLRGGAGREKPLPSSSRIIIMDDILDKRRSQGFHHLSAAVIANQKM